MAYVSTAVPLAMAETALWPFDEAGSAVALIPVESLAEPELSSGPGEFEAAFGESDRFAMLDRDAFSANDLWYVTV
ncbi:MAG TPA: hypothetical protein VFW27_15495 [Actinoplanes sp.]|nr:hypothetical protein [Actinoplanes sp.]